jgi:hypothetical protein
MGGSVRCFYSLRVPGREEGQAVVEAAIVLPAFICLVLVSFQLTQLQQARLLTEYAAFAAARAGIVMNGGNGKGAGLDGPMHDAAVMAVLPSFGRTDSFTALGATLLRFEAQQAVLRPFGLSQVRVYVHNPVAADFRALGKHLNGQEIDFDDVRPAAAEATLLSLQVRYLYEMRVPFANKMIQTIWMAAKSGTLRGWAGFDWTGPRLGAASGPDAIAISRALASGRRVVDGTPEGIQLGGFVAAGLSGRYFLPLQAFYTMRMQSNPYLRWAHP